MKEIKTNILNIDPERAKELINQVSDVAWEFSQRGKSHTIQEHMKHIRDNVKTEGKNEAFALGYLAAMTMDFLNGGAKE